MECTNENNLLDDNAKSLLATNKFTKELEEDLKSSAEKVKEDQTKLLNFKETQWRMKHEIKSLMIYFEFLNQLSKAPEHRITTEQVAEKTSEILDQYKIEKNNHKELVEKCENLGETYDEAEAVLQCDQDIRFELEEIKRKSQKLRDLEEKFNTKHDVFENLCETEEEAENLVEKTKAEIERKKEMIALVEKCSEIDSQVNECAEGLFLRMVEEFLDTEYSACDTTAGEADNAVIESLTSRLLGREV